MAALNRSGLFALRLCNANSRSLSTTAKWLAEKPATASPAGEKISKKVEIDDIETTFPRSKQLSTLIEVEGAVDVGTTSVRLLIVFTHC